MKYRQAKVKNLPDNPKGLTSEQLKELGLLINVDVPDCKKL